LAAQAGGGCCVLPWCFCRLCLCGGCCSLHQMLPVWQGYQWERVADGGVAAQGPHAGPPGSPRRSFTGPRGLGVACGRQAEPCQALSSSMPCVVAASTAGPWCDQCWLGIVSVQGCGGSGQGLSHEYLVTRARGPAPSSTSSQRCSPGRVWSMQCCTAERWCLGGGEGVVGRRCKAPCGVFEQSSALNVSCMVCVCCWQRPGGRC